MPNIKERKPTEKQELFAKAMYTIGLDTFGNGTESAIKAGYKGSKNQMAVQANKNIRNPNIIALKQGIQADTEKKLDLSREKQHIKLESAIALAIQCNSPSAIVSAIKEQNSMLGYNRDKAPNSERQHQLTTRVSDEQRRILIECADLLLRKQVDSKDITSTDKIEHIDSSPCGAAGLENGDAMGN